MDDTNAKFTEEDGNMSDVQQENAAGREPQERFQQDLGFPGDMEGVDIDDFLDDMNIVDDPNADDDGWNDPWKFQEEAADLFESFNDYLD